MQNLPKYITTLLQKHKYSFEKDCYDVFTNILKIPEYKIALKRYLTDIPSNHANSAVIKDIISENIENKENFVYKNRIMKDWEDFAYNEIFVIIKTSKYISGASLDSNSKLGVRTYGENLLLETSKCFSLFWEKDNSDSLFKKYENYELFTDFEVDKDITNNILYGKILTLNPVIWDDFVIQLITDYFPNFEFNKRLSKKGKIRLTKKINNEYSLAIEFNKGFIKKFISTDLFPFPKYFNLVLISNDENPKSNRNTVYELSLGILGNPFSFLSLLPPDRYVQMMIYELDSNKVISSKHIAQVKQSQNCERLSVEYNKGFVLRSKQYIIYYMSVLQYTSLCYLDYLEKVILDLPQIKMEHTD